MKKVLKEKVIAVDYVEHCIDIKDFYIHSYYICNYVYYKSRKGYIYVVFMIDKEISKSSYYKIQKNMRLCIPSYCDCGSNLKKRNSNFDIILEFECFENKYLKNAV